MILFLKVGVPLAFALFILSCSASDYLRVNGNKFLFGETNVFLSGVNFAWNSYAYDFGNGEYLTSGPILESWIKDVAKSGGNSARIWLHCEGQNTPNFDSSGVPTAPDKDGTLISELSKFLDVAASNNVFVILVLWNGAVGINGTFKDLIMNDVKLDAYLKNVITPMVKVLKSKPALAAWEIMNEPEGSVETSENIDPCLDTAKMKPLGGGWTNSSISMNHMLKFINRNAAAIKNEDPKSLVTLGSWSYLSQTEAFPGTYNYYTNSCLVNAGGEPNGTIDFYQMHTYSWVGKFAPESPFMVNASSYELDKPLVIGEFSASCGAGKSVVNLWSYAYQNGYNGIWSWQFHPQGGHCSDTQNDQLTGMKTIKSSILKHGQISVKIN